VQHLWSFLLVGDRNCIFGEAWLVSFFFVCHVLQGKRKRQLLSLTSQSYACQQHCDSMLSGSWNGKGKRRACQACRGCTGTGCKFGMFEPFCVSGRHSGKRSPMGSGVRLLCTCQNNWCLGGGKEKSEGSVLFRLGSTGVSIILDFSFVWLIQSGELKTY